MPQQAEGVQPCPLLKLVETTGKASGWVLWLLR
jgi:hypothetical protein